MVDRPILCLCEVMIRDDDELSIKHSFIITWRAISGPNIFTRKFLDAKVTKSNNAAREKIGIKSDWYQKQPVHKNHLFSYVSLTSKNWKGL